MKKKIASGISILIFGLSTLFLLFLSYKSLDPDFGWHLRMGEIITHSEIPSTDPLSYTMPSFPFIDHEWLTNVLIFWGYHTIGYFGLAVIFTGVLLAAFFIATGKWKVWSTPLFIFVLCIWVGSFGIRPQVLSWLFLAIVLRVEFSEKLWKKYSIFLPFLILLWANLHGSFPLGIVVICAKAVVDTITTRKIQWRTIYITIASIFATFVNPYGPRLWYEIWQQMTDSYKNITIIEWHSALTTLDPVMWTAIGLSTIIVMLSWKKFSSLQIVLYILLLMNGLSAVRGLPLFMTAALFLLVKAFIALEKRIKTIPYAEFRFEISLLVFLIIVGFFSFYRWHALATPHFPLEERYTYPTGAIQYLKTHPSPGNLFAEFSWGGYIDWKLPVKKVFVDGRMPTWKRTTAPTHEATWAFHEYIDTEAGVLPLSRTLRKYTIDTILIPKRTPIHSTGLGKTIQTFFGLSNTTDTTTFEHEIKQLKMKKVYEDRIAVIYRNE